MRRRVRYAGNAWHGVWCHSETEVCSIIAVANHLSLDVTEFQMRPESLMNRDVISEKRRTFTCLISGAKKVLVFRNAAEELGKWSASSIDFMKSWIQKISQSFSRSRNDRKTWGFDSENSASSCLTVPQDTETSCFLCYFFLKTPRFISLLLLKRKL